LGHVFVSGSLAWTDAADSFEADSEPEDIEIRVLTGSGSVRMVVRGQGSISPPKQGSGSAEQA
jgi:hypothetical protein